jgi:NhaP-type Na+/H+ or K+/H+ antiporter
MPALAVTSFETAVPIFGGLLVLGALVAAVGHRSVLSLPAVFVLAGFVLGPGVLGLLQFDPHSDFVRSVATVALVLILFRDGLEVEAEMLQRFWRPPVLALAVAMPLTAVLIADLGHALLGLSWTESLLVGALLCPTDPVLSASVVTNRRVPAAIRHSLNLESGLNDGLALPAVLAFAVALDPTQHGFVWWQFVVQDIGVGTLTGLLIAVAAATLLPRQRILGRKVTASQKSLYALGVAFATYGVAVTPPHGNGLIAVFVCAIALGSLRADIRRAFEQRSEELIEVVKLGIFVIFGSLLTLPRLLGHGSGAVILVLATLIVVRPLAIFIALASTSLTRQAKAFIGWFGPKGVATMTFALLVLSRDISAGERIFGIAALAVVASTLLHGLTDHPGSEWMARHAHAAPESQPASRS